MRKTLKIILICTLALASCKKQNDWLDAKRQISDNVPKTLKDFQAIIDNSTVMNSNYPTLGLLGGDDYYFPNSMLPTISAIDRNSYLWNKDIFEGELSTEYSSAYSIIAAANIILEGVEVIDKSTEKTVDYNNVKGQALFFRSIMFYELAAIFCKPYDKITAATDLGICIRTKSDIHHLEPRSTVEKTYEQITKDLKIAAALLPVVPVYKTRPCKSAAFALLAKTYLQMGDYVNAKDYADSTLNNTNAILDYNSDAISISKPYRFPDFKLENPEIIFYATSFPHVAVWPNIGTNRSYVDTLLYRSYEDNDLRKVYLFAVDNTGNVKFRGPYTGSDVGFSGIGVNEVYLIRAECNARLNNLIPALSDFNKLLQSRYKKGTYIDFVASSSEVALIKILEERRKELPFTGQIRWQDLRRLNKDLNFARVLKRSFNGISYELLPGDKRYVYPFPQNEIDRAGIEQNER